MGLTQQTQGNSIILQAKHYCIWRAVKQPVPGCESIEVNNPITGVKVIKHGFRYANLTAFVTKLEWYDTGTKFDTQYVGYKLHLIDGAERFILDMPLNSPLLRRFMRIAPNLDFTKQIWLSVFRGKGEGGVDPTAIWFKQDDQSVLAAYTKDNPNGLPPAKQLRTGKWNFDDQTEWLIDRINEDTVPAVQAAAEARGHAAEEAFDGVLSQPRHTSPVEAALQAQHQPQPQYIGDDDVPF